MSGMRPTLSATANDAPSNSISATAHARRPEDERLVRADRHLEVERAGDGGDVRCLLERGLDGAALERLTAHEPQRPVGGLPQDHRADLSARVRGLVGVEA